MKRSITVFSLSLLLLLTSFSGCGYNQLQQLDESIKSSWAEVLNQYQRRSDLIPNLVNVVKGYASHEQEVLENVTKARSQAGSVQLPAEALSDPQAVANFQQAQSQLGGALTRLLAISENYPALKADANFRELQAQIEGTENRIAVARKRYIDAVQEFNVKVRSFPSNLTAKWLGMQPKPSLAVEDEKAISKPPVVDFSK